MTYGVTREKNGNMRIYYDGEWELTYKYNVEDFAKLSLLADVGNRFDSTTIKPSQIKSFIEDKMYFTEKVE